MKGVYTFIIFYLIVWVSSPLLARYFLSDFLESNYALTLSEKSSIRYNPFTSHLTVQDFMLKSQQKVVFGLEKMDVEIRLHRVIFKQLYISELKLHGMFITIQQIAESMLIAGVDLSNTQNTESQKMVEESQHGGEKTDFELIMPSFEFFQSKVNIIIDEDSHVFTLDKFSIKELLLSLSEQTLHSQLVANIDGAPVNVRLSLALNEGQGLGDIDFSIQKYDLKNLSKQLPKHIKSLNGMIGFSSNGQFKIVDQGIVALSPKTQFMVSDLEIVDDDSVIQLVKQDISFSETKIEITLADKSKQNISLKIDDVSLFGAQIIAELDGFKLDNKGYESNFKNIILKQSSQKPLSVEIGGFSLDVLETTGNQKRLLFTNQGMSIGSQNINIEQLLDGSIEIGGVAEILIGELATYIDHKDHLLAKIDTTKISQVEYQIGESKNVSIANIKVEGILFSDRLDQEKQPEVAKLDMLDVNAFEFNNDAINISRISLNGFNSDLHLDEKQSLSNLVPLSFLDAEKQIEQELPIKIDVKSATEDLKERPLVKIDLIELTNFKSLSFLDKSVQPTYKREVFIDEMILKDIDTAKPQQESAFKVKGRSDQYTKFDFEGKVKPFTEKVNLTVKGHLSELSLPPTSSYIQDLVGFQFESGELDTKIDVEIKDSNISGNTAINIRGFELAATDNYEQDTLKEQTAMPLNVAFGMLKDGDGNVELDIPMLGNIDSPSFGYGSFIALITKKAIQAAAQEYLVKTFFPYAELLSITFTAGEFIFKTRFEDLIYEPAQTDISDAQLAYMQQFIALMKDKENTQVKACAIATNSDLTEQELVSQDEEQKVTKLKLISQKRMTAFKEFVVAEGIKSSRILTCATKVDVSEKAQSKIQISI